MYGILIFLSMAKQVTLTHLKKKTRIEINNYLEDQSVDRNGTTAGSENGAEINSEPTTSTDANRQADVPMANRRSLLPVLPDRVDDLQPKSSPKPAHFNKNQPKILTAKIMWYDFITMSIKINKDNLYLLKIK